MKAVGTRRMAAMLSVCALSAAAARAAELQDALSKTKPLLDLRVRMENVEQDPIPNEARAITLRARLGFETGKAWNTALLVEGEGVTPLRDQYRPDPLVPSVPPYPVVADREGYEINRLQLTNTSLPDTTITLGRQRIALDDQRFIGGSAWRQNEQTFDALRVVNRGVQNLVLDVSYLTQVNRVNGPESRQGRYEGDSFLVNAGYQTKAGKLSAFGYLLDFDAIAGVPAALTDSTSTIGVRFAGEKNAGKVKLAYAVSYATQTDYGDNPLDFDLGYLAAELTATVRQYSAGVGTEVFEGNGVKGFTTPLGTLHKFQGWADKFLTTPANGIEDRYVNVGATYKGVGGFDSVGLVLSWHDYAAEHITADYGSEWNVSVAAKYKRVSALLKYADYEQGVPAVARDTRKLWAQLEFTW